MNAHDLDDRLSRIATNWAMLAQAHEGSGDEAAAARQRLMERYCGAVYRYLLAAVRDPHAAEDLTQEFALRFVRGLFRHADPARGRFRDYVKSSLFHLVDDYRRRAGRLPRPLPPDHPEPAAETASDADLAFTESWRAELLARTWKALEAEPQPHYIVLRFRVENPDLSSPDMAAQLTERLGRPVSAANVRQLLHRAREKFAELLLAETEHSLGGSGRLEDELAELDLLKYCRPVLEKRRRGR